ncbi:hypothetical protein J4471_00915 [Candidatus Woesearchaeota archaeon]|nr:hypothetical protein [Candidatus Woesearchaeota archaeon]
MSEISILNERPVSIYEVREKLNEIKKRDKELSFRAKKTEEFVNNVQLLKEKKAKELYDDLINLNIEKLKPRQIVKIIDVIPKDSDSLKTIFTNEPIALSIEEFEKVIEVVKKYA